MCALLLMMHRKREQLDAQCASDTGSTDAKILSRRWSGRFHRFVCPESAFVVIGLMLKTVRQRA
jgi:hypothetical protein